MSNPIRRLLARLRLPGPRVVWDPTAKHWRAERSLHRPYPIRRHARPRRFDEGN